MKHAPVKANCSLPQHWWLDDTTSTTHVAANQLPLISNTATTGHKLQGSSLDAVHVPDWNYSVNWPERGSPASSATTPGIRSTRPLSAARPKNPCSSGEHSPGSFDLCAEQTLDMDRRACRSTTSRTGIAACSSERVTAHSSRSPSLTMRARSR